VIDVILRQMIRWAMRKMGVDEWLISAVMYMDIIIIIIIVP